jgi:hypothetical protein
MDIKVRAGAIVLDIGDKCTHCGRDTAGGSGLWVDRIPAYADSVSAESWLDGYEKVQYIEGYLCRECLEED